MQSCHELTNACNKVNHSTLVMYLINLLHDLVSHLKWLQGLGAFGCISSVWFVVCST